MSVEQIQALGGIITSLFAGAAMLLAVWIKRDSNAVKNIVDDPVTGVLATHVIVNSQSDKNEAGRKELKALLSDANETIAALRDTALSKSEARERP